MVARRDKVTTTATGSQYRQQLIQETLGLVNAIALKICRSLSQALEVEELISYGRQGLVEAAARFDPSRGVEFATYAYYRIKGAIYDGLREQGWLTRMEYLHFLSSANSYLQNLSDRPEPHAPAAASVEQRVSELADTLGDLAAIFVTSATRETDGADRESSDGFEALARKRTSRKVRRAMELLPERERRIIELHYFEELSLTETSEQLGLSKSWTSRLHARAVRLLSSKLAHMAEEHET